MALADDDSRRWKYLGLLLFEVAYFAAYQWGMTLSQSSPAALWPPDAILLAALLLAPRSQWWWYLLGAVPVRLLPPTPLPFWFISATFADDVLKALVSALVFQRITRGAVRLSTLGEVTAFVLVAGVLSPVLSASGGAAARSMLGDRYWVVWYQWMLGDALTAVVLTPAILFAAARRFRRPLVSPLELGVLAVGVVVSSRLAFFTGSSTILNPILLYAPVPFLFWAVVRVGPAGSSIALAIVALFAILGAKSGSGPFVSYGPSLNILSVQLFLFLLTLPMTVMAVLLNERQRAEEALADGRREAEAQNDRLRVLAGRLITAQEDERRRIAREMHDDIGQRLSIVALTLKKLEDELPPEALTLLAEVTAAQKGVDEIASDIHHLSHELHSARLQHLGLHHALRGWCRQMTAQHDVAIDVNVGTCDGLPADVSLCLYRVAQEALNNAVKHGGPRRIAVDLSREATSVRIRIKDSGCGFDPTAPSDGLGLPSMRERLRFIGGDLVVRSAPGSGTELVAEIQLPVEATGGESRTNRGRTAAASR